MFFKHVNSKERKFFNLFNFVLEILGNDIFQVNFQSLSAGIVFSWSCFFVFIVVLFWQKLCGQLLKGYNSSSLLIKISEDKIKFKLRGVNLILEHELREVIGHQISFFELIHSLEDCLYLEIGIFCYFLANSLSHDLIMVAASEVLS